MIRKGYRFSNATELATSKTRKHWYTGLVSTMYTQTFNQVSTAHNKHARHCYDPFLMLIAILSSAHRKRFLLSRPNQFKGGKANETL